MENSSNYHSKVCKVLLLVSDNSLTDSVIARLPDNCELVAIQHVPDMPDGKIMSELLQEPFFQSISLVIWAGQYVNDSVVNWCREINACNINTRFIVLSHQCNDNGLERLMQSGCSGVLLLTSSVAAVKKKISAVVEHHAVLDEQLVETLISLYQAGAGKQTAGTDELTDREQQILSLIAKGFSNKIIAKKLEISDGTVKVHVKHLLKKLRLNSRVEAAIFMLNHQKASQNNVVL